jgi:murein L,D-transpeptidase YafK
MRFLFLFIATVFFYSAFSQNHFLEEQLNYSRVKTAKENHHESLSKQFEKKDISFPPYDIYLRSFKFDKEIEVWIKPKEQDSFVYLKSYSVCETSGSLGPKREQGDLQIPEGFYNLTTFNPVSNYHLSLKVNYPNTSDRLLGNKSKLGGDIFIHGKCATIGCLPIEDHNMEELYWLAVLAKANGGKLPVHIFPFRMDDASILFFNNLMIFDFSLWSFWYQLKPMFDYFEVNKKVSRYEILEDGTYFVKDAAQK